MRHDNIFRAIQIPQKPDLYHFCKTSIRYKSRSGASCHTLLLAPEGYNLHTALTKMQGTCLLLLLNVVYYEFTVTSSFNHGPHLGEMRPTLL
jgi:hypothetical protein